ncbi:MAG: M48 family metalloprotease [Gemmatimonadetes bacterium]|nr:M48 family metalloprotease [Gemmatimonadota bacterium]NIO32572.1 M48 family metalloprotease [Gemmatimonadota bacterium]
MGNYAKIFGLMAALTALVLGIAYSAGGPGALVPALVLVGLFNFGMYWFSDSAVLRMYRARVIEPGDQPALYEMVDQLRQRAGLPMPRVAIAPSRQPNAFATGRNPQRAVVCFTEGILAGLSREELEGVAAHELAHIKNRDMLTNTVAATMAGAVMILARFAFFFGGRDRNAIAGLAMLILAPLAAFLVQMAISRQMEFRADRVGAQIAGTPRGLAQALLRLENLARRIPMDVSPSAAHVCIVNPLRRGGLTRLFTTHPPVGERVARLDELAGAPA